MPFFSFHCPSCDATFEALVAPSVVPPCPSCGAAGAERQLARLAPDAKLKAVAKAWRAQAAREGHMSNVPAAERRKG